MMHHTFDHSIQTLHTNWVKGLLLNWDGYGHWAFKLKGLSPFVLQHWHMMYQCYKTVGFLNKFI